MLPAAPARQRYPPCFLHSLANSSRAQLLNTTYPTFRQQPFNAEPSPRTYDMFTAGVDPGTPTSFPFLRCPRHLHHACEICADSGRGATARSRGGSRANDRTAVTQGGGISGFAEGAGVGGGLARPGPGGTLLRRSIPPVDEAQAVGANAGTGAVGGNTRLAEHIPRFLRLSALVALELGREVGVEEIGPSSGRAALAPTVQWYLLLAGLLTRALLEGYLTAGWTGLAPVQVLLGVGLGSAATPDTTTTPTPPPPVTDDEYVEFEPDGMPDLTDAVDVLFPSWGENAIAGGGIRYENSGGGGGEGSSGGRDGSSCEVRGGGEIEYAREMAQRLARVCNLLALPWRYPRLLLVRRFALMLTPFLPDWPLLFLGSMESSGFMDNLPRAPPANASFSTSPRALQISPHIWKTSRGSTLPSPSNAQP
jgi:hypothetical protein